MKILVLGASGIIGQHMRLTVPIGVHPIWLRSRQDPIHIGLDLSNSDLAGMLEALKPTAIVNLAGESRPDVVENDSTKYRRINVTVPGELAKLSRHYLSHLIQISTQAVFDGRNPPYGSRSQGNGANFYGRQKLEAEKRVKLFSDRWTIVRPTFILGIRPMPHLGRSNPVEQMLEEKVQRQVGDRWFSPAFARDVARAIWEIAIGEPQMQAVHVGIPERWTRFGIAQALGVKDVIEVSHSDFSGLADRPTDTTYDEDSIHGLLPTALKLSVCREEWNSRQNGGLWDRTAELAIFLGTNQIDAAAKLKPRAELLQDTLNHEFRQVQPKTSVEWCAESVIWEQSAHYLVNRGTDYRRIVERLSATGTVTSVLCILDGIGELTLALHRAGFHSVCHTPVDSRTTRFAEFRFWRQTGQHLLRDMTNLEDTNVTAFSDSYDAIVVGKSFIPIPDYEVLLKRINSVLRKGQIVLCSEP